LLPYGEKLDPKRTQEYYLFFKEKKHMATTETKKMTSLEIREKLQELYGRSVALTEEKTSNKEELARAIVRGANEADYVKRTAEIETELAGVRRAIDLLGIEARRVEKAEKLEAAKTLAADSMKRFEKSVLPKLKEALAERFRWRQEATIKFIRGEDNYALSDNDPLRKTTRSTMPEIIKFLDEQTELAARPAPKPQPPEKTFPEPPTPRPHGVHTVTRPAPRTDEGGQVFVQPETV
jgi:hypothetical protein